MIPDIFFTALFVGTVAVAFFALGYSLAERGSNFRSREERHVHSR